MRPVLFTLGPLTVYSFGVLLIAGVGLSVGLMLRRARRDGFPTVDEVYDLVFWGLLAGLAGARLLYIVQNFGWYRQHPASVLAVWEGGLIFYGGLAAGFLAVWVWARRHGRSFFQLLDLVAPYTALSQAFGRIGCFLNGCCGGKLCPLDFPLDRHPAQLYEALYAFVLFFWLSRRYERSRRLGLAPGSVFWTYALAYAAGRFMIEFVREGNPALWVFTFNQWESMLLAALSVFLLRRGLSKSRV